MAYCRDTSHLKGEVGPEDESIPELQAAASPDDTFNYDWILAALLSSPCPHCANDDLTTLSSVKDNADDEIIARHCGKCGECFGFDDACDIDNLENLQTAFKDGDITMADPCPGCGNRDIHKFTLQQNEHGGMYTQCVVCDYHINREADEAYTYEASGECAKEATWVDYETDNPTAKVRVVSFSGVHRGDHIAWWNGFKYWYHAIVEHVDPVESTVRLIGFWIENAAKNITVRRKTQKVDLKKEKIYRVAYTRSHSAEVIIDRAISRLGSVGYDMMRNNSYTFATWCKIGKHNPDIDYSHIRGLLGRVLPKASDKESVTDARCLKVGDHLSWHRTGYWHHGIVTDRTEDSITVTEFAPPKSKKIKGEILQNKYNVNDDRWNVTDMYKSKYPIDEDPSIVVKRALLCVGHQGYHVLKNNCEHFATWCKTGVVKSDQVELLVKSITHIFGKSPLYLARLATGLALDVVVPAVMPLCGGALILGAIGSVRAGLAAKRLHQNRRAGKDISDNICEVSQGIGSLVFSVVGFVIGELIMPIGGGVIGSMIGSVVGEILGHFIGHCIVKFRSKKTVN